MVTTCSDTRFAVLQDVGIILSGIKRNNHIICGFLSLSYPWDNKHTDAFSVPSELFKWIQIVLFHISGFPEIKYTGSTLNYKFQETQ